MDLRKFARDFISGSRDSAMVTVKDYTSNISQLASDAKSIGDSLGNDFKTGTNKLAEAKKSLGRGQILSWFTGQSEETSAATDPEEFDSGKPAEESAESSENEDSKDSVKSFIKTSRQTQNAMYNIGQKQVEASIANTADIVSTINTRTAEMIAIMNDQTDHLKNIQTAIENLNNKFGDSDSGNKSSNRGSANDRRFESIFDDSGNIDAKLVYESAKDNIKAQIGAELYKPLEILGMLKSGISQYGSLGNAAGNIFWSEFLKKKTLDRELGILGDKSISQIMQSINDKVGQERERILLNAYTTTGKNKADYSGRRKDTESNYTTNKAIFDEKTRYSIISIIPAYLKEISLQVGKFNDNNYAAFNIDEKTGALTKKAQGFAQLEKGFEALYENIKFKGNKDVLKDFQSRVSKADAEKLVAIIVPAVASHFILNGTETISEAYIKNNMGEITNSVRKYLSNAGFDKSNISTLTGLVISVLSDKTYQANIVKEVNATLRNYRKRIEDTAGNYDMGSEEVMSFSAANFENRENKKLLSGLSSDQLNQLSAHFNGRKVDKTPNSDLKIPNIQTTDTSTTANGNYKSIIGSGDEPSGPSSSVLYIVQGVNTIDEALRENVHLPKPLQTLFGGINNKLNTFANNRFNTTMNKSISNQLSSARSGLVNSAEDENDRSLVQTCMSALQTAVAKDGEVDQQELTTIRDIAAGIKNSKLRDKVLKTVNSFATKKSNQEQISKSNNPIIKIGFMIIGVIKSVFSSVISKVKMAISTVVGAAKSFITKGFTRFTKFLSTSFIGKWFKMLAGLGISGGLDVAHGVKSFVKGQAQVFGGMEDIRKSFSYATIGRAAGVDNSDSAASQRAEDIARYNRLKQDKSDRRHAAMDHFAETGNFNVDEGKMESIELPGYKDQMAEITKNGKKASLQQWIFNMIEHPFRTMGKTILQCGVAPLKVIKSGILYFNQGLRGLGKIISNSASPVIKDISAKLSNFSAKLPKISTKLSKLFSPFKSGIGAFTSGFKEGFKRDEIKKQREANPIQANIEQAVTDKEKGVPAVVTSITDGVNKVIETIKETSKEEQKNENNNNNNNNNNQTMPTLDLQSAVTNQMNTGDMNNNGNTNNTPRPEMPSIDPQSNSNSNDASSEGAAQFKGITKILNGIGKSVGGVLRSVMGIGKIVVSIVTSLASFKTLSDLVSNIFKEGIKPLNKIIKEVIKVVRPLAKVLTNALKQISESVVKIMVPIIKVMEPLFNSLIEIVNPILEAITSMMDAIMIPLFVIFTTVIKPSLEFIVGGIKAVAGGTMMIASKVMALIGYFQWGVGKIIDKISITDDAGETLMNSSEGLLNNATEMGTTGVQLLKQGLNEAGLAVENAITNIGENILAGIAMAKGTETTTTNSNNTTTNITYGSAFDGQFTSNTDSNSANVLNITGNGNFRSQGSYNMLGMKDHGCGPVALADTVGMDAGKLASAMSSSGRYSSSSGTSVGDYMATSSALGRGLTAGGVTNASLNSASRSNPITLVGSGSAFGTHSGNNHFMNVIGTDGSNAYVNNPITGRTERHSKSELASQSVLGLYGNGDFDASSLNIGSSFSDTLATLKDIASSFTSIFGEKSSTSASSVKSSISSQEQTANNEKFKKQLSDLKVIDEDGNEVDYISTVESDAKAKWKSANPNGTDSDWETQKYAYIYSIYTDDISKLISQQALTGSYTTDENGDPVSLTDYLDSFKSKINSLISFDTLKKLNELTKSSSGKASKTWETRTQFDWGAFNPYYNTETVGGYAPNTAVNYASPCAPKNNALHNCVGYAMGRFREVVGDQERKLLNGNRGPDTMYLQYLKDYSRATHTGRLVDQWSEGDLEVSGTPRPGDIGWWYKGDNKHVAFVEDVDSDGKVTFSQDGYGCSDASANSAFIRTSTPNSNGEYKSYNDTKWNDAFVGFIHNPYVTLSSEGVGEPGKGHFIDPMDDGSKEGPLKSWWNYLRTSGYDESSAAAILGVFGTEVGALNGFKDSIDAMPASTLSNWDNGHKVVEGEFLSYHGYYPKYGGMYSDKNTWNAFINDADKNGTSPRGTLINENYFVNGRVPTAGGSNNIWGFGIGSQSAPNLKQDLWDYTRGKGKSLGDRTGQMDALVGKRFQEGDIKAIFDNKNLDTKHKAGWFNILYEGGGWGQGSVVANNPSKLEDSDYYNKYKGKWESVYSWAQNAAASGKSATSFDYRTKNAEMVYDYLKGTPVVFGDGSVSTSVEDSVAELDWDEDTTDTSSDSSSSSGTTKSSSNTVQNKQDLKKYYMSLDGKRNLNVLNNWENGKHGYLSEKLYSGYPTKEKKFLNPLSTYGADSQSYFDESSYYTIKNTMDYYQDAEHKKVRLYPQTEETERYNTIQRTKGSGDIPPIDMSKFNVSGTASESQSIINARFSDESLQVILNHTFEVRSSSMELILNDIRSDLNTLASRSSNARVSSKSNNNLFSNDIPSAIQRLSVG